MRHILLAVLILFSLTQPAPGQTLKHQAIYSTWETMEIDKCASAWLLKRFVDQNAVFKFFPKGALIPEGIPFDVPEAQIRRYHNLSTFEYLLEKNSINDPALNRIALIIHDIEINFWGEKKMKNSEQIHLGFQKLIQTAQTPAECVDLGFEFFDKLYADLK